MSYRLLHKNRSIRKNMIIILILVIALLAGCGKSEAASSTKATSNTETASNTEAINNTKDSAGIGKEQAILSENSTETATSHEVSAEGGKADSQVGEPIRSCVIQEDEKYFYICGKYRLIRIDKETKETQMLWENTEWTETEPEISQYAYGEQILLSENNIYFIDRNMVFEGKEGQALRKVSIDGKIYEESNTFENLAFYNHGMVLLGDRIYLDGGEWDLHISVDNMRDAAKYQLSDRFNQIFYDNNERHTLFSQESLAAFGYELLLNNKNEIVKVMEDGTEEVLKDMSGVPFYDTQIKGFNDKYFLLNKIDNENDIEQYFLVDISTKECRLFLEHPRNIYRDVVAMDDEYLYVYKHVWEEPIYVAERIDLETGNTEELFTQLEAENWQAPYWADMDSVVKDGYWYYIIEQNYALYLARRNVEEPWQEEIISGKLYDSGIGEVGSLTTYYEGIYSDNNSEILLAEVEVTNLYVDDKFLGAEKINQYLTKREEEIVAYEQEMSVGQEELAEEFGEEISVFRYNSTMAEVSYFNENYVSWCQEEFDYQGGAHDMLSWTGYTFDLQTGEQLLLSDIVGNSEEELVELVKTNFINMIEENPDRYWENASALVEEYTTYEYLSDNFYLTEQGLCFYYSPYDLACFAEGFQMVEIPYEELELKLSL